MSDPDHEDFWDTPTERPRAAAAASKRKMKFHRKDDPNGSSQRGRSGSHPTGTAASASLPTAHSTPSVLSHPHLPPMPVVLTADGKQVPHVIALINGANQWVPLSPDYYPVAAAAAGGQAGASASAPIVLAPVMLPMSNHAPVASAPIGLIPAMGTGQARVEGLQAIQTMLAAQKARAAGGSLSDPSVDLKPKNFIPPANSSLSRKSSIIVVQRDAPTPPPKIRQSPSPNGTEQNMQEQQQKKQQREQEQLQQQQQQQHQQEVDRQDAHAIAMQNFQRNQQLMQQQYHMCPPYSYAPPPPPPPTAYAPYSNHLLPPSTGLAYSSAAPGFHPGYSYGFQPAPPAGYSYQPYPPPPAAAAPYGQPPPS